MYVYIYIYVCSRRIQILISRIIPISYTLSYVYIDICILSANANSDFWYNSRFIYMYSLVYIHICICILSANTNSDFSYNSRKIYVYICIYCRRIQILISRIIPGSYVIHMYTHMYTLGEYKV